MPSKAAIALLCCATAQAQPIAQASKSPYSLMNYVQSEGFVEWDALWNALGTRDPDLQVPPCTDKEIGPSCQPHIEIAANPPQAILIIEGFAYEVYLRYFRTNSGWQFSGERSAFRKEFPRRHELTTLGGMPFLKISSDHSAVGFAMRDEVEDWFDLTQPGLAPVFSFSPQGNYDPFAMAVGRELTSKCHYERKPGVESIELSLDVNFSAADFNMPAKYKGVYERHDGEKKFTLRTASIPKDDFVKMSGFDFTNSLSNEQLILYSYPVLQKLAATGGKEDRAWLTEVLKHAANIPEKRTLLDLLAHQAK